jgi:hypothetical protein
MYIKIGNGTFHQGSVLAVSEAQDFANGIEVTSAHADGVFSRIVRADGDVEEEIDRVHDQLKSDAEEEMEKRRSQRQLQGGQSPFG